MDWKAKKHITEQLDSHCHRGLRSATTPGQHKRDIKQHRLTVVNLVEGQIGKCNCKFSALIRNAQKCQDTRRSEQIVYGLIIFLIVIACVYAAMVYGAVVGAANCSKDDFGCAQTLSAKMGVPGLQFKRNKQRGVL